MPSKSAKEIIEGSLSKRIAERADVAKSINAVVAIDLKGEGGGRFVIDMVTSPATIKEDAASKAVTTISMDIEIFEKMVSGELDPQGAFLTGKVKVDGNLGIAIKLGQFFN